MRCTVTAIKSPAANPILYSIGPFLELYDGFVMQYGPMNRAEMVLSIYKYNIYCINSSVVLTMISNAR